jgi:hypothetical protein
MANTPNAAEFARQAEQIYEQRLKDSLESTHRGQFLAIEPESGEHFLGRTLSEAIGAARKAHPDRLAYVLRVGQTPAIQIGRCGQ